MKTDTPMTDQMLAYWQQQLNYPDDPIPAEFARIIERDRDTWKCREEAGQKVLTELHNEINPLRDRLETAEEILSQLASGYWMWRLNDAAPEDQMGEKIQAYWRKANRADGV